MRVDGFDWDRGNSSKIERHGIPKDVIEEFFQKPIWVGPDPKHSSSEERFIAVGKSSTGRPMIAAFILRRTDGALLICPHHPSLHAQEGG